MRSEDLPQVLALQAEGYSADLHDSRPAFESRMALSPTMNLVARRGPKLVGYLVSHPWASHAPPPVDAILPAQAPMECWYVHDLSVAPAARGTGVTQALLERGAEEARRLGLERSELIAVAGAAPFWEKQGWQAARSITPALAAKVAGYGAQAVFMSRAPI